MIIQKQNLLNDPETIFDNANDPGTVRIVLEDGTRYDLDQVDRDGKVYLKLVQYTKYSKPIQVIPIVSNVILLGANDDYAPSV